MNHLDMDAISEIVAKYGYVEWALGNLRSKSSMHVITEIDPNSGALFAHNPYNTEFRDRTAFLMWMIQLAP